MPFFDEKCAKIVFFYMKTVKIPWRLGATPPNPRLWTPLCHILGAAQTLLIIFAYYYCVDGTEIKDAN